MQAQHMSVSENTVVVRQHHRKLSRLDQSIREMSFAAAELEKQIRAEEKKSGISDPKHFAYPTFAKAAAHRRDNLLHTITVLKRYAEAE
jgi:hypothetical protein